MQGPTGRPDDEAAAKVTVMGSSGAIQAGLPVYAFDGASYTGYNGTRDANGQAVVTLPQGSYRFRTDKNGTQFWSGSGNDCAVPGRISAAVTDFLQVSVVNTGGTPQAGLPVYAFDGTTYTGYNQTTDASGQAIFTLPNEAYRFRSDKNGTQFWSATANDCAVPGCTSAAITVTQALVVSVVNTDGTAQSGLPVYVFNDASYTGYNQITDANGQATFTLPMRGYHFRAELNGTQFWSGTANHCTLPVAPGRW